MLSVDKSKNVKTNAKFTCILYWYILYHIAMVYNYSVCKLQTVNGAFASFTGHPSKVSLKLLN